MKFITNNHYNTINKLISDAKKSIKIISPFLKDSIVDELLLNKKNIKIEFITRINFGEIISDYNSLKALQKLINNGAMVYSIKRLHSKLIIVDEKLSIFGSANFTNGGLKKNIELSALVEKNETKELVVYFNKLKNAAKKQKNGYITSKLIIKFINEYNKIEKKYRSNNQTRYLPSYGANIQNEINMTNKRKTSKSERVDTNIKYYVLNTNERWQKDVATNYILTKHKAACWGPAMPKLYKLNINDRIFLYKNGCGIVACGSVCSKVKDLAKSRNEANVDLTDFVSFADQADNNPPFLLNRNTLYQIKDAKSAERYYKDLHL